jgi:hypothetical protein
LAGIAIAEPGTTIAYLTNCTQANLRGEKFYLARPNTLTASVWFSAAMFAPSLESRVDSRVSSGQSK